MIRPRKRPINNAVAAPVFGEEVQKDLPIPRAIDAYNYGHGFVDIADHLRKNSSCQRKWDKRVWRPLTYWLFDTCLTNSYIIWRSLQPKDVLDKH